MKDQRVKLILISIASAAFMCLPTSHASATSGEKEYCVLHVGDLNADGMNDYAVSKRLGGHGTSATAYVIFGGTETIPDTFDETYLKRRAAYILRGPTAAPFACAAALPVSTTGAKGAGGAELSESSVPPQQEGTSPVGQPIYYTIAVDLNTLSPGNYSLASAINKGGLVVGRFLTEEGLEHAYLYDGWDLRDLGTLGGHFSDARGINTPGDVVGYSLTGETDELGFVNYAFISDGFGMRELGIRWSAATDINDTGQIVGEMKVASGVYHAFLYEGGKAADLGTLDGAESFAYSVNESGQVVGEAATFIPGTIPGNRFFSVRGFLYENGTMQDLGSLGYSCVVTGDEGEVEEDCFEHSSATDINNIGQIAGFSTTSENGKHAFLRTGGSFEDLGTLGGLQSWAYAVNDSGQVVGTSLTTGDAAYQPFLFDLGTLYDLRELVVNKPNDFSMWGASDINNFGQIVGINYLLNPLYQSISPGQGFSFSDTLGRELTFEYWVSTGDIARCVERNSPARLEFRIDSAALSRNDRGALVKYLGRWQPVDDSVLGCADSEDWRTASITLPSQLEGKEGTVSIQVRKSGAIRNPTVYLRHFR